MNEHINQEIHDLKRNYEELHSTVFNLVTEITVIKKTLYGNGRRGVAEVLDTLEGVVNQTQLTINGMQSLIDNNKDVFNNRIKTIGLWIAGIGLLINAGVGVARLIIMSM